MQVQNLSPIPLSVIIALSTKDIAIFKLKEEEMSYIKKKSKAQEVRTAKEFGGKTQQLLGSWTAKGMLELEERTSSFNETDF